MSKSRSHTDQSAIFQHAFNEELGALEVVLVGAELKVDSMTQNVTVDTSKMEAQLQKLVESTKSDDAITAIQSLSDSMMTAFDYKSVQVVNVPQIIVQKEVQIVEVPVIVEKIVEREVEVIREVPGSTKIEVVTVDREVQVIVTKTEYKDLSKLLIAGLVLQGLVQVIVALIHK